MDIEVKELHVNLLNLMQQFHQICIENNIRYYMLGGTCLGARRHKGFIPWDDDMDVGIPREDYERFCSLAKSKFPNNVELKFYENTQNSPFHYAKFINRNTTLIEQNYRNYVEGLYIDVFPLDGTSEKISQIKTQYRMIWFLHAMIMNHESTSKKNTWYKELFKWGSKLVDLQFMHREMEKKLTQYDLNKSNYIANFLGAWGLKEIMQKSIFGTPTLYRFEECFFYGPEKIDEYLHNLYGDFMKLPPENQRVLRHSYYYIDLNMPYKIYLDKKAKKDS